jgi:hypothetical protein
LQKLQEQYPNPYDTPIDTLLQVIKIIVFMGALNESVKNLKTAFDDLRGKDDR